MNNNLFSSIADCGDPGAAPTNGQKVGTDYTHGSTVVYSCDSGYTLVGTGTLTCTSGSWDNPVPNCEGVFIKLQNVVFVCS